MVRNFTIWNRRPLCPPRHCLKKTGPRESITTAIATAANTGSSITSATRATRTSKHLFALQFGSNGADRDTDRIGRLRLRSDDSAALRVSFLACGSILSTAGLAVELARMPESRDSARRSECRRATKPAGERE